MTKNFKISVASPLKPKYSNFFQVTWYKQIWMDWQQTIISNKDLL